jgi:hypothetical protein
MSPFQQQQVLLTYGGKTFVYDGESAFSTIAAKLSAATSVPLHLLTFKANAKVLPLSATFESENNDGGESCLPAIIHASLSLLGGKGGFGALLKAQAKQAGAKRTEDFGACRDLNGRRLRHINDEIKLQKFHERQEKVAAKVPIDEIEYAKTSTGIRDWHLGLPSWSDGVSNKESYRTERRMKNKVKREEAAGERKKSERELKANRERATIESYADVGATSGEAVSDAVMLGLMAKKKEKKNKRKREGEEKESSSKKIKCYEKGSVEIDAVTGKCVGLTEFGTISLGKGLTIPGSYYYEVLLSSGGVTQIGWASKKFVPSSVSCDGVGDDEHSWAWDGSREMKFTGGVEEAYGIPEQQQWNSGDVVGCGIQISESSSGEDETATTKKKTKKAAGKKDTSSSSSSSSSSKDDGLAAGSNKKNVSMQYWLNGESLGNAFEGIVVGEDEAFTPVLSLNQDEEVFVRKDAKLFSFAQDEFVAIN